MALILQVSSRLCMQGPLDSWLAGLLRTRAHYIVSEQIATRWRYVFVAVRKEVVIEHF